MLAALSLCGPTAAGAQSADGWFPESGARMARTVAPSGERLWMVTRSGFVTYRWTGRTDADRGAWGFPGWRAAGPELAGVSFDHAGVRHERLLMVRRAGSAWDLLLRRFEGGMDSGTTLQLRPPSGVSLQGAALALAVDRSGSSPVLSAAASSLDGRLCLWRWTLGASGSLNGSCTAAGFLDPETTLAAADGATPFYYVRADGSLGRSQWLQVPTWWGGWLGWWQHDGLGRPPAAGTPALHPSVSAVTSKDGGQWVFVATRSGEPFVLRAPAGGSTSWSALPPLPPGSTPPRLDDRTALSAVRWLQQWFTWSWGQLQFHSAWKLTLFVTDGEGRLLRWESGIDENVALGGWLGPRVPPGGRRWAGGGLATVAGGFLEAHPVLWGVLASEPSVAVPEAGLATLVRFDGWDGFDDFLYYTQVPWPSDTVLGRPPSAGWFYVPDADWFPATEGNVHLGGVGGLAAAIRREHPWRINLSWSAVGGASFGPTLTVEPLQAWGDDTSGVVLSDPFVAYDPVSGIYHFIDLEAAYPMASPFADGAPRCAKGGSGLQMIVYRQATDPSDLATRMRSGAFGTAAAYNCDTFEACVVGSPTVPLDRAADHAALLLRRPGSAVPAEPHVVLWNAGMPRKVYHWWKPATGPARLVELPLAPRPPSAFLDAAQDLYAYSFPYVVSDSPSTVGYPDLCRIDPASGNCEAGPGGMPAHYFIAPSSAPGEPAVRVSEPLLFFDKAAARHPYACHIVQGSTVRIPHPSLACFQTAESFSFAAHPEVPGRLYAVFQGRRDGEGSERTRVFFIKRKETDALSQWSPPIDVTASLASSFPGYLFFDPEISVDAQGTLVVTFAGAPPTATAPLTVATTGLVHLFVAVSTDEGDSFQVTALPTWYASFRPADLPYHCGRGMHFLGEYRRPAAFGGHAFHLLPVSGASPLRLEGRFFSRWGVY